MQAHTHLPTFDHCQKERDDRCRDQCGTGQIEIECERQAAVQQNGEQRSIDDFRIQFITIGHEMSMVRAGKCQAQHPNQTEAEQEQLERHGSHDGDVRFAIDQQTDQQRQQHHRDVEDDHATYESIPPSWTSVCIMHPPIPRTALVSSRERRIGEGHRLERRGRLAGICLILSFCICLTVRMRGNHMNLLRTGIPVKIDCLTLHGHTVLFSSPHSSDD